MAVLANVEKHAGLPSVLRTLGECEKMRCGARYPSERIKHEQWRLADHVNWKERYFLRFLPFECLTIQIFTLLSKCGKLRAYSADETENV